MDYPGFLGADYRGYARTVDQELSVNLIFEREESPGAVRSVMFTVPGFTLLGTQAAAPGRAHFSENDREWAVFGSVFCEIKRDGSLVNINSVAVNASPATICSNGKAGGQLLITSGGNAYVCDTTTLVLTQIVALNGKATMGSYIDGYGLVLDASTSTFYFSALDDFSSWTTGIDFNQRSKQSDPWRAQKVNGIYIGLFGEKTSEFWFDAGGSNNPFAPDPSGEIPYGIAAAFSIAVGEGAIYWLGQSASGQRYVLRATGFNPEVVSDLPRQALFDSYSVVSDARGEVINWRGHTLYLLTFPTQNITWAYDLSTNVWFQWGTWISELSQYSAMRACWHVIAFGQHRMLDSVSGAIYKLDADSRMDVDGRPLRWLRRAPALCEENELIFYTNFELNIEPGVGLITGQGSDPQVMLRISRDGGATWGPERWQSIGKIGAYMTRVIWNQIGSARRMVIEVAGSDPVPAALTGAYLGDFAQPIKALASKAGR